jgi:adenylate cyclase
VVLESSLRRQDARLRITARLTEVKSGTSLWSRSFNLKWGDVFSVQEAIAQSIVRVLKIQLNADDCDRIARSTHWTEKDYELYLLGKFYLNRVTPTNISRGMSLFRTVIARDPSNAPAHAALAKAWSLLALSGNAPVHETMPKALKLAAKARSLEPHLPDVHVVLGIVQSLYQWKWQAAEESFRRAIQSNPSHAEARSAYAFCVLLPTGRTSSAIDELLEAVKLDPVALNPRLVLALAYYAGRDPALAVQQCKRVLEVDPACLGAHAIHGLALTLLGDYVQAAHKAERVLQIAKKGPFGPSLGAAGCLFALAGSKPSAAECLEKLGRVEGVKNHCWIALVDAALGRKTEALRSLASALKDCDLWVPSLAYQPLADPLRPHARFRALIRKIGLAG